MLFSDIIIKLVFNADGVVNQNLSGITFTGASAAPNPSLDSSGDDTALLKRGVGGSGSSSGHHIKNTAILTRLRYSTVKKCFYMLVWCSAPQKCALRAELSFCRLRISANSLKLSVALLFNPQIQAQEYNLDTLNYPPVSLQFWRSRFIARANLTPFAPIVRPSRAFWYQLYLPIELRRANKNKRSSFFTNLLSGM